MKAIQYLIFALTALMLMASPTWADSRRDAQRVGAFAGAMKYCAEHDTGREGRYKLARYRAFKEVNEMSSRRKLDALAARNFAYDRGRYWGRRLDRNHCRQLLGASEWRRFFN
ncbi:hypothetical protein HZU75_05945 [Chitinibacter fontanus]|uniref:Uncharacterized protein n=1 Tax=Chitinibacter fontanus TaxID=1737446 RepID=A0A7D5ZIJ9_9NEIS|nr:hypothetical protein [Chitinibacter fontanus]QLI81110.1 hypothetical protein HZU75_05945 [Chitinibacter fontanus]